VRDRESGGLSVAGVIVGATLTLFAGAAERHAPYRAGYDLSIFD